MDIDDFLSRFEGVTPSGDNKWKALCPAHDDHNPSLSITVVEDGKKLLKCFAGCTYGAILKALNLRSIDLNPSHGCTLEDYCRTKKLDQELLLRRGVSEYIAEDGGLPALRMPYLDAAGIEVGGRFRLALNGDKFRTFKGTSPVLYGLNILANPIEEVTIVEGESDTQTLLQFGYPAVGVPGASTWKEAWVPLFANKRIIFVIIEPDQGGRTLRAALESSELAPRINFVELPNGFKDVSSFYLDSPETFERRMDEVLDSYLLVSLGKRPRPAPRPYLIEGAVPSRCVSALYGEGGAGKSLLALYTAICVCTGQDWFGHATQQGNVMYVDAELDEDEMTTRAYQLAEGMGLEKPPDNLRYHRLKGGVMAQLRMLKTLRKQYDIQLTVLDSLTIALLATAVNESKEIIPAMEALERQLGTTLVIDHTAKAQPGADLSQMTQFGSVFKRNMARSVFKLTGSTSGVVRVDHGKHNFGPVLKPWAYKCEWADTRSVKITTADALDVGSDYLPRKDKIVVYIRDKSGSWHRDLVSAFCNKSVKDSVSEPTLNRDLKELLAEGRIYKEARGLYHVTGAADTVVPAAVVDGWGASDLTDTVIQHLTGTTGTPDTWWE